MGLIEFDEVMDELSFSGMEETSEVENDVSEESDDDFEDDDMMDAATGAHDDLTNAVTKQARSYGG